MLLALVAVSERSFLAPTDMQVFVIARLPRRRMETRRVLVALASCRILCNIGMFPCHECLPVRTYCTRSSCTVASSPDSSTKDEVKTGVKTAMDSGVKVGEAQQPDRTG